MISFILNDQLVRTDDNPGTVLLDFIRERMGLTGTREACREGECGACTVLIKAADISAPYKAVASCITPLGILDGHHVVVVEGVNIQEEKQENPAHVELNAVQKFIVENNASQCGFCTPGIVLSLTGFCLNSCSFTPREALTALDGNMCRCTGYASIRNAACALAQYVNDRLDEAGLRGNDLDMEQRISFLVQIKVLPSYFLHIQHRLDNIKTPDTSDNLSVASNTDDTASPCIVAGGTDLFVQNPDMMERSNLLFLSAKEELLCIREEKGCVSIGGAVTIEKFRNSPLVLKHWPFFEDVLLLHSSTILRNSATLAGNLANASPIGDISIILLALDATLFLARLPDNAKTSEALNTDSYLRDPSRGRHVKIADFFKAYKEVDLQNREIIAAISIPLPRLGGFFNYEKVSNRRILDIAAVNSAMYLVADDKGHIEDIRISAGGVAPVPLLAATATEKGADQDMLKGRKINTELVRSLAGTISESVTPIDDIRGSALYKKLLLKNLIHAHFHKVLSEAKGNKS